MVFTLFSYKWFYGLYSYSYNFQFGRSIFYLSQHGLFSTARICSILNSNIFVYYPSLYFSGSYFFGLTSSHFVPSGFFYKFDVCRGFKFYHYSFNPYLFAVFSEIGFKLNKFNFNFVSTYNVTNSFYYNHVRGFGSVFSRLTFLSVNSYLRNFYSFNQKFSFFNDLIASLVTIDFRSVFQGFEPFYEGDYLDTSDTLVPISPFFFSPNFLFENRAFFPPDFHFFRMMDEPFVPFEQIDAFVYDDSFMYRNQPRVFERVVYSSLIPNSVSSFSRLYSFICSNSLTFINFFNLEYEFTSACSARLADFSVSTYKIISGIARKYRKVSTPNNCCINPYEKFAYTSKLFFIRAILLMVWELYYFSIDAFIFANNSLYFLNQKLPDFKLQFNNLHSLVDFFVTKQKNQLTGFSRSVQLSLDGLHKLINRSFQSLSFKLVTKVQLESFLTIFIEELGLCLRISSLQVVKELYDALFDYFSFNKPVVTDTVFSDSIFQTELLSYMFMSIANSKRSPFADDKLDSNHFIWTQFNDLKSRYFSGSDFDFTVKRNYNCFFNGADFTFRDNPDFVIRHLDFFFRQAHQFERFSSFELNMFSLIEPINFVSGRVREDENVSGPTIFFENNLVRSNMGVVPELLPVNFFTVSSGFFDKVFWFAACSVRVCYTYVFDKIILLVPQAYFSGCSKKMVFCSFNYFFYFIYNFVGSFFFRYYYYFFILLNFQVFYFFINS